jgi:Spy/CpxP family protein refolding chaperone
MTTAVSKIALIVSLFGAAPIVAAQGTPQATGQAPVPNQRREMLEQRLRERTGEIVKRRLELNDAQMKQLQATNQQFEKQRGPLLMHERELRRELRQQIMLGDKANQNRVGQLLDQTMQVERQRLDVVQSEQRELAKFLTPVQRAKLLGLQNEMRRRAQQLRDGQMQRRNQPPRGQLRFR